MKTLACLLSVLLAAVASADEVTLGDYSYSARLELEGRVRKALADASEEGTVAGTVTFSGGGAFFIQGKEEALKVVVEKGSLPASGDVVEAKGHPAMEGGRVVFVAGSWKRTGRQPLPPPRKVVDSSALLFVGESERERKQDVNWLLVEVEGRALSLTESGFAIEVDDVPVTVAASDIPDFMEDCAQTHPLVSVTGVAELVLDQSVLFDRPRQVMGVKLNAVGAKGIVLHPDAEYLINRRDIRVMRMIVAMIIILVFGLVALVVCSIRQSSRQLRTKTLMDERKRMADDLHDTIEQHLVGAGMLLQLNRNKEAGEILVRAKREMRDIIWGLKNDDMMRLTPSEMIKQLAHEETKKGLYRVTARLEGLPAQLDAQRMRDLSLIVREAIGNAVKHGGAKKIAISGDPKPNGGWLLRIANDGAPFDAKSAPGVKEGHFGVEGMRQRARRLGAEVSIAVDGAWTVVAIAKSNTN